jgi:hypothetical protein
MKFIGSLSRNAKETILIILAVLSVNKKKGGSEPMPGTAP